MTEMKKWVCNGLFFLGNLDLSLLTPEGPVVPLVCGFRRRDNLLAWCEMFANLNELNSRIWYWEEYNHSEEFIGYLDLTDFRQISPKLSRNNEKKFREIVIFEIFVPWRPFMQHALHIFSYSNFRCRYLDNQSEYWKSLTHEVDGCLVKKTVEPFCSCCDIRSPIV